MDGLCAMYKYCLAVRIILLLAYILNVAQSVPPRLLWQNIMTIKSDQFRASIIKRISQSLDFVNQ